MKVLIVDDSTTIRRVIQNLLNEVGIFEVVHACNGYNAIKSLTSENFDLVILDMYMDDMTGIDVLDIIRQEDKNIHVIMCSRETEKKFVLECIKKKITDYISKPFNKDIFVSKVLKLVDNTSVELW